MDKNKTKVLAEIGYRFFEVCGSCEHSEFKMGNLWGVCLKHTYNHKKHTDSKRQLSIHVFGKCRSGYEKDKNPFFNYDEFESAIKERAREEAIENVKAILPDPNLKGALDFIMGDKLFPEEKPYKRNAAKCKKCGDVIESRHRHEFKMCSCGAIGVDGGLDYLRRVGKIEDCEDLSEPAEESPREGQS